MTLHDQGTTSMCIHSVTVTHTIMHHSQCGFQSQTSATTAWLSNHNFNLSITAVIDVVQEQIHITNHRCCTKYKGLHDATTTLQGITCTVSILFSVCCTMTFTNCSFPSIQFIIFIYILHDAAFRQLINKLTHMMMSNY